MRECWRAGIVPLLQMHDSLDLSVSSPEQAELAARLGRDAVKLEVPMKVDVAYGRTWGDAKHTWEERDAAPEKPAVGTAPIETDSIEDIVDDGEGVSDDVPISDEAPPGVGYQIGAEAATATVFAAMETPPPATEPPAPATEAPPHSSGNGYGGNGLGGDGYSRGETATGASSETYIYKDAHGAFYMKVVRTTDKKFPTYRW